jgi:predicted glycogen debranching enzyme|uniref:amylo-alpha-1,6-glucosidase n=1 Tax=Clostridium sp. 12(A) TaxID=1163671 RepID=UPI0004631E83|nr:amylo-alpha-1,6-glucosidase [Clostridium sp. 12(A)]
MKFIYGKYDWKTMDKGQENSYLLTNGFGGYSSLSGIGSNTRNDHALLMACMVAPNHRYHMITRMEEQLSVCNKEYNISSQEFVDHTKNQTGYRYLNQFSFEDYPIWIYQVKGVEIKKQLVLVHRENSVVLQYEMTNYMDTEVILTVTPHMQFVSKGETLNSNQEFEIKDNVIKSNGLMLYCKTNGSLTEHGTKYEKDLYFGYDARDGREAIGVSAHNHSITISVSPGSDGVLNLIYSTEPINEKKEISDYFSQEEERQKLLITQSGVKDELAKHLVKSADQFLVERDSTRGKTLMAGYPFFADWGRDTMISMIGCCIATRRFEEAKSIFYTFMHYENKGLMPNMFPEGGHDPLYNTVDASLLFIGAVYEYYLVSNDLKFVKEAYPVMEDIIEWYQRGTDYHIKMDYDGLIMAGSGLEQVTWMDVRFGDILPTPRHGKPVEINAYWFNDLKIMGYFARLLKMPERSYKELSDLVRKSFQEKFWNEKEHCLKDLVSGEAADDQIRCNQIWAVSQPFSILDRESEIKVVNKVYETLYTPYGLRSLSKFDKDFKAHYGGSLFNRDMAYHQGTVWAFPLGAYYLAYLKVNDYGEKARIKVKEQLSVLEACMREGCIGQIAEIYDGDNPTVSQGCFAQAWSVSELLRVFVKLEQKESQEQPLLQSPGT